MSGKDTSTEERPALTRRYWLGIVGWILLCAFLWFFGGMAAGGGIHEWGMYWFGAVVLVLPVVILVALNLAWGVPATAARRGAQRPLAWGRNAVLLWFLVAFLATLAAFLIWAS